MGRWLRPTSGRRAIVGIIATLIALILCYSAVREHSGIWGFVYGMLLGGSALMTAGAIEEWIEDRRRGPSA